jgi:hypothetical protein
MKELTHFYKTLAQAATVCRKGITDRNAAREAMQFEERLTKLAATAGKSAKPRKARRPLRAKATA